MIVGERRRPRILVADDDVIFRSVCAQKLRPFGLDLIEVGDGIEAWHQVKAGGIALALVDIDMPNMNGITLVKCIRGHRPTKHLPIVMITSHEDVAALRKTLEAGATAYLTKPVNWSLFADHIAHLVALGESRQAFEEERAQLEAEQAAGRLLMHLYAHQLELAEAATRGCPGRRDRLRQLGATIARSRDEAAQRLEPAALLRQALADRAARGSDMARVAVEGDGQGQGVRARPEAFGALVAEIVDAASVLSAGGADVRCGVRTEGPDVSLWISGSGPVGGGVDEIRFALGSVGVLAALVCSP